MKDLVPAIEEAYIELINGRGGNRLRSDIVTPTTQRQDGLYALKSMDGVIPKFGVGAVRINSDILTFPESGGQMRRVKMPAAPGDRYVGLVLLFSTHDGAPLLICPDGVMQRMRVGATSAVAAKYMAKKGSQDRDHHRLGLAGRFATARSRRGVRPRRHPGFQSRAKRAVKFSRRK